METENDCEINRARDAIQMIQTIQTMIDVSADRLKGLRTQCLTSAELTQQEIRTLEGKLVKHFSKQLVIKAKFGEELQRELSNVPSLELWLRVVGLGPESIVTICSRVSSLEALRERSDHELGVLMPLARDEEVRRLCRAMQRLRSYTDALARGESVCEMPLYWDSWERHRVTRTRGSNASDIKEEGRKYGTPVGKRRQNKHLPAPDTALSKSRSHDSQLAVKPDTSDLSDNSQSSAVNTSETSPPSTPQERNNYHATRPHHNNTWWGGGVVAPTSPMSPGAAHCPGSGPQPPGAAHCPGSGPQPPGAGAGGGSRTGGCMAHDIAHRFRKSFSVLMPTCDYCEKQIFGNGLKCKECKFKCHRECERKVPPSCGLPPEFVNAFRETVHKDGKYTGGYYPARASFLGSLRPRRKKPDAIQNNIGLHSNRSSSSNTSSCNSSAPSSPAPAATTAAANTTSLNNNNANNNHHHFHFPEVKPAISSANHTPIQSPARITNNASKEKEDLTCSVRSDSSVGVSLSGSASTDSGGARADSLDKGDPRWPRQNSLSMKEWDIPYSELQLFEVLGAGRFGTVYRGSWHGAVAVKLLHLPRDQQLDTFRHEVATFRKTRHENLVLFMGACMKPPKLCIVTSLCCGMTLHQLIHLRRDKFTPNKSVIVAQQISQGMGYLHARGIIHKDLKTKNIFLENGKVVITDFGLFSVTKLCFANNARGDSLGIPAGWLCYLAPELVRALRPHASLHLPFSKHTDVYAFGTVVYELLCGEWPFSGERAEAVIWQVGSGVKQSLAALHASPDMKEIVSQCWAYKERERPTFPALLASVEKLPRKRLARSPSHPLHLSRSADTLL